MGGGYAGRTCCPFSESMVIDESPKVGNGPAGVIVKNQMTKWGSCTKDGTLNLNWRIAMAPMSVVGCVVVHELVHLDVQDHSAFCCRLTRKAYSQAFWSGILMLC